MSYGDISNSEDIMDSRDIIKRIGELKPFHVELLAGEYDELDSFATEAEAEDFRQEQDKPEEWEVVEDGDESDELRILTALADEGITEWEDGATLIRHSYFTEYAEQLADDLGLINKDVDWPLNHIDWDAAADALKIDYTSVDFDGVEYWVRA